MTKTISKRHIIGLILFISTSNIATAAQDHNASRSNTSTGSVTAGDTTLTLLNQTKQDAYAVAKKMLAVDQRDGYKGEYQITVNMGVSIKRIDNREK